jgi:threonine synthase
MIRFCSTRGNADPKTLTDALRVGLAPGGGLYVPERFPVHDARHFAAAALVAESAKLARVAERILAPFFEGDLLAPSLAQIARAAFDFPIPMRTPLGAGDAFSLLELFHGPTAAFKDVGARFLAACMGALPHEASGAKTTVLVATSGDTGGAVAAAFHRAPLVRVVLLYPKGKVSPLQEQQLTCFGENVQALAVRGTFDDCQRLVKAAFADSHTSAQCSLTSANSINIGRLLPQSVYYATASLELLARTGRSANFIIPSGNLGNAVACLWAKRMGLPVGRVILAHNENRTVPEFFASGVLFVRASVATLASAMDVGDPSNLERLRALYPQMGSLREEVEAVSISDVDIRLQIAAAYREYGTIYCPHTAVAAAAYAQLSPEARAFGPWVVVATAHPAKFREIVEPLIGCEVPLPDSLARLLSLPSQKTEIEPALSALRAFLE